MSNRRNVWDLIIRGEKWKRRKISSVKGSSSESIMSTCCKCFLHVSVKLEIYMNDGRYGFNNNLVSAPPSCLSSWLRRVYILTTVTRTHADPQTLALISKHITFDAIWCHPLFNYSILYTIYLLSRKFFRHISDFGNLQTTVSVCSTLEKITLYQTTILKEMMNALLSILTNKYGSIFKHRCWECVAETRIVHYRMYFSFDYSYFLVKVREKRTWDNKCGNKLLLMCRKNSS